jgi:hypothetical protein
VTNRVIKRVFNPQINIKYTGFPHIFLHSPKVFHKSYSFAQRTLRKFFTSLLPREKVYHTYFRAPQNFFRLNHRKFGLLVREKRDVVRIFTLSTKSAAPTATTTTKNFIYFYFLLKKERFF